MGQQNEHGLVLRVVESPLQRGEVLEHRRTQPIDRAHTVMDNVQPVRGKEAQIDGDLGGDADGLQIGAHAGLVGDDPRILRVGLSVTPIRCRGVMHNPARDIEQLLPVRREQSDQQRSTAVGEIRCPTDLVTVDPDDSRYQVEQLSLVIADLGRQQDAAFPVDHDAVMGPLAGVDSGPECWHENGPLDQMGC